MHVSCVLSRISSTAFKVHFPRNQILKSRITAAAQIHHYHAPLHQNHFMKPSASDKNLKPSVPLLTIAKQFSTSSSKLASHKDHDHSKIWNFERVLSVLLLPVVPAALLFPCQQLDTAMALLIVMHTHFGLEAIIVDYIRPILFGEIAPKIGIGLLYLLSIVTLAGLLNLIYNDCGLANTLINVWKK